MEAKKKSGIVLIVCIIIILCVITFSRGAALRAAAFLHSPKSAISMKYEKVGNIGTQKTLYRITENPPVEKATESELYTWVVYSFGPFHFAEYYGEV